MKRILFVATMALISASAAHAGDGFETVRCDSEIAKNMIGRRGSNEPVVAIEGRHRDLGLKDVGASDFGRFSAITWLICGKEFMVLEHNRTNVVHDVLEVPPHADGSPEFQGQCKLRGRLVPETVVAILRDESGRDELPVEAAWRIDEKRIKFVRLSPEGLLCPRAGIWKLPAQD